LMRVKVLMACIAAAAAVALDHWMTLKLPAVWLGWWNWSFNGAVFLVGVWIISRLYASQRTVVLGLLRLTKDPISLYDLKGAFLDMNEAKEQLLGLSKKERMHTTHEDWFPEDQKERARRAFLLAVEGRPQHFDAVCVRKDGVLIDVEITYTPILSGSKVAGVYVTMKDITEMKRSRELLQQSERLAVIGELAAGIAHEIRNPLTSLRGFVQLNRSTAPPSYTEIMLSEIDRIHEITSELLLMGKPKVQDMEDRRIVPLIHSVLTLINTQALLLNIEIVMECEEGIEETVIRCEETKLKQVFLNLLKNAMEAMPNGGKITIKLVRDRQWLLVNIADSGIGIPEEKLARLGQAFFTTKEKGTGLGLMISFRIMEQHHGSISIDSMVNEGTTVQVRLPAV